jgi:hypothetical protein
MGGGVPFEEHLSGVGAESLFADPVPPVVGIADIRAEHPQRILVTPHRRLLSPFHRAQIAEKLLHQARRPRPRKLIGRLDEALNQARSPRNRVSIQVAAQLLITPTLGISLTVWASGCNTGTEPTTYTRPLRSTGKTASTLVSLNESLNHLLNHYHICAGSRITLTRLSPACRPHPADGHSPTYHH